MSVTKDDLEDAFKEAWEKDPTSLVYFMMLHFGKLMVEANAETSDLSLEATIDGQQYKISAKAKLKKIKT